MNDFKEQISSTNTDYKSIFISIPIPVYIWEKKEDDFLLIKFNKSLEILTDGEINNYLGKKLSLLFENNSMMAIDIRNCYNNNFNYCKEIEFEVGKPPKKKTFLATYIFIPSHFVVVFTEDLTRQKQIEKSLRKAEQEKTIILESISEHLVYQDLDNKILWTNKAAAESVGLKIHNLIGKKCYEIWPRRDSPCEGCPVIKTTKSAKSTSGEIITPDGRIWLVKGDPVFNEKGKVVAAVEITKEITQIKKAEESLKKTQLKYRELFESSPYSIFLIDMNGIILDCNSSTNNILSVHTIKDLIGIHFKEALSLFEGNIHLIPRFEKIIQQIISGEQVKDFTFPIAQTLGKTIWVSASVSLVKIIDETLVQFILKDITEKKITEEKLKDSELKYRESFNRSNFYKDLFAHDINNILQNILSAIDLLNIKLQNKMLPEESRELLSIINDQVNRGSNLVSNVRTLSDVEDLTFSIEEVNALKVLNEVRDFLIRSFHEKKVEIIINSPYNEITIYANQLLSDLFENILINAIRYNRNTYIKIQINISKEKKENIPYVKFEFIDNGIGIPDIMKEKIFQRGYSAKEFVSGLGIGLTLVKKILNLYNGQVWVEDKIPGDYSEGSNFVILLPEVVGNN